MKQLAVYLCGECVGLLSFDNHKQFVFQYDLSWREKQHLPPLSLSLPFQEAPYPNENARPFFTNLLPEAAVREAVARKLGISQHNDFALLEALGGECAGAVTLYPPGIVPEAAYTYRKLSSEAFRAVIQELSRNPLLAGEEGIRLSLAGAQNKLPVYLDRDHIWLPQGAAPSSHIIKINIPGIESSVRNEAFCMALAGRVGLNVPQVQVLDDPVELFVVERYDRRRNASGRIERIHQEDFCQATGRMAESKYESEGGLTLADCFTLLDRFSSQPAPDRKALLQWIVFNLIIHNADGHAKNLALLLAPEGIRLAPFYDLLCTSVYPGITSKMAMKIGRENRPKWIQLRHWERLAKSAGIKTDFVLQTVREMAHRIESAAGVVAAEQAERWGAAPIITQIQKVIGQRSKSLLSGTKTTKTVQ